MSAYQRAADTGPGLRLHLNENTAGCSPAVLAAVRGLTAEDIAFYPRYEEVEQETAAYLGVDRPRLLLVNGLDEGIQLVSLLALRQSGSGRRRGVIPEPAFEMYAACTHAAGGDALRIRPGADLAFQLDDIRAALDERTSLLYVTSPGNPTGRSVPVETIAALAAGARDVTILVDEAYVDFGGETAIPLVDTHHNVIVGRTFAKAFGLAALRAGCLVAHPETLAPLRAMVPPYTLNVAAAAGLRAALRDRAWRDHYIRESEQSRRMVYEFCEARGLPYYRSDANFVLVRVGKAGAVVDALAARGIFIRDRSSQPGCAGCVRITAGVVAHTAHCLDALAEVL